MKATIFNRLITGRLSLLFLGLTLFCFGNSLQVKATPVAVSFQVFYDELSPYGDWVEDPNYGFIWIPYVDQNFQPYRTNGHWVMSSYGNTWVSNYDWGWAPFHYGRWFFSDMYGWSWIPGYEWGPAWVNWRTGRGYYGWYPMAPRVQFYASIGYPAYSHWIFVPRRRLLSRNLFRYYVPYRNVNVIYNQTTIINNTYVYNNRSYVAGPSRSELQRVTRRNIPVYEVSNGTRPGRSAINNNRVQVYRPDIRQANSQGRQQANARPARVISSNEYSRSRTNATLNGQRRGTNTATSPRSNTNSVRTEALSNSGVQNNRSARMGSQQRQPENNSVRSQPAPNNRQIIENSQRRSNASQNGVRNNQNINRQQSSTAPNQRRVSATNQRQVAPAQRQVKPAAQPQRQVRSTAPARRQVAAPAQRKVSPAAPQRQQVQRSAPSSTNRVRTQPSRRQSSSPRVNSSSRSQSRSAAPQRSQRSTSSSRRGN